MKPTEKGKKLWNIEGTKLIPFIQFNIHDYHTFGLCFGSNGNKYVIASNPTEIKALLDMGLIEFEK